MTHVVNFELPDVPESYVHRIGRTARAGAAGIAISLCDAEERDQLRDIERLTRQSIPAEDRRRGPAHGSDPATHREPNARDTRSADPAAGRRAGSAPARHQAAGRGHRGFGGSKGGVRRFSPPAGAHAPRAGRA